MLLQSRDTQQETSKECKVDPRLLKDCDGRTPYDLCTRRRYMAPIEILRGEATNTYMALIPVLNPALPLIRALDLYPPTERIVGAPSLKQIAAKAVQQALLHQIRVVVRSSSELSSSSQGGLRGSGAFDQNKSGSSSCNLPKDGGHAEKQYFPEDVPSGLHALQLMEAAGQSFGDEHGKAYENECPELILPNTPEPVRESKVKGADVYSRMLQQPLLEPSSLSRQYNHEWSATPTTEGKCYEPPLSVLSVEPGLGQVKFICRPHHHHHHCLQLTTCITCMEEKPCLPVEPCHHSLCGCAVISLKASKFML
ncbi:hypothetical protein CEUSTIGMA_g12485.t1 [Chlamydomonas eustigma]|uniref:Uncharacterized protein n=1 Tax=Chlamydomonas eustigma TaxID=1157962 RepID=A0A250XPS4_9CHLO|nr:hypothetical protein CEUSTIGMA_g12485.t1 [Chlamydomonas eustigma]|eukprot:GAX85065.1 hypothetical protein CEUSTIGMA_g12485.t1 [Chlamydomonas eustigma]